MLLKWITLHVPPRHRTAFAAGQEGWRALAALPGFGWQVAGWDAADPDRFGALSLWDGRGSYRAFMAGPHDVLAAPQRGLFDSAEARLTALDTAPAAPVSPLLWLDPEAPDPGLGAGPFCLRQVAGWRVVGRAGK